MKKIIAFGAVSLLFSLARASTFSCKVSNIYDKSFFGDSLDTCNFSKVSFSRLNSGIEIQIGANIFSEEIGDEIEPQVDDSSLEKYHILPADWTGISERVAITVNEEPVLHEGKSSRHGLIYILNIRTDQKINVADLSCD